MDAMSLEFPPRSTVPPTAYIPPRVASALSLCDACLIGETEHQLAVLRQLTNRVGFGSTSSYEDMSASKAAAVTFFLVHAHVSLNAKLEALDAIRRNPRDAIRFAPVILIAGDCDVATAILHIQFGFDDVLALPDKAAVVAQRLESQVSADHTYIQTLTYLGPDRRRLDAPLSARDRRERSDSYHESLIIRRDPRAGVKVVHRRVMI